MPLLNAFVDSFVCVGFSSERGLTFDPESKNNESIFTSDLQSSILAILTGDRAIYPLSRGNECIDSSYPPIYPMSSRSSLALSIGSGRSTPISSLTSSMRAPKQHPIPAAYKDLPFFCFPDGVRATYQREKEKIHHFVLTQDEKRSYALAFTFQQQFSLKTNTPDDDGVYQISDVKLSTLNTGRPHTSRIPVPIDKHSKVILPSPTPPPPTVKLRSRKMPSAYPVADTNSANKTRSPSVHDTSKTRSPSVHDTNKPQSPHHYETQTYSSYQKNLSSKVTPPPSRIARARSQDNVTPLGTPSTTSSASGMRKRTGSIVTTPPETNNTPTASSQTSTSVDTATIFYLPQCIVLISTEPYWTALQETISIIHDEITRSKIDPSSNTYKKLIQKYAFLACNTPIPPVPWERFSLSFNVTDDQFVISFDPPINTNRPVLDLDLSMLLLTLNIGKLLDVLTAIFTEQPIIFFSSNYSTLVTTLECLLYLIYPLRWTNVYIPLVPDGLRDIYLEGPSGIYIKGAHSRHQSIVEELNISLTCNLDNNKNIHVPEHVKFHSIPPTKMQAFADSITKLLEEIKVGRALKNVPTVARLRMEQQRELDRQQRFQTNQKITKIFLAFMIDLYGDVFDPIYWKVNPQQISPTNTFTKKPNTHRRNSSLSQSARPMFSKEKYLHPKREGIDLEFYRAFVETTGFQYLLKEEMLSISSTGFKQICQIHSLSTAEQLYDFNNIDNNQIESTTTLCDSLSSQMVFSLPDWSSDFSTHYLDSCIEEFTAELNNAQQEKSSSVVAVYAYLRGCARLARGDYLEGLRDLYSIENSNLFPKKYIQTVIVPRLADECLLDSFLGESYYTNCPEWKKVQIRARSESVPIIDLMETENVADAHPVESSPDVPVDGYDFLENVVTYQQFSNHVHRSSIVLDKETTETLFKALLYWTDNSTNALKKDATLTNSTNKPSEPIRSADRHRKTSTTFTFEDTMRLVNNRQGNRAVTPSAKTPIQSNPSLPIALFESFLDAWQQTNTEKVRMNCYLPEDRQKQESILKISSSVVISKKDGPGQLILTQKGLYFLPQSRSSSRLLTELIRIVLVDKYENQSVFRSAKPGIKIHTSSQSSSLPRDNNVASKSKSSSLEKDSKLSSISLYFTTNQEQELWYIIIVELWSGLTIAYEQCDTAVLNKASRHIALMDTLINIDYDEQTLVFANKQLSSSQQKSKQQRHEANLEMALKDLSIFTRMHQTGTLKPLSNETRNVLTRRLSPSINETERHAVRCLIFTEHPDTGHSFLWCAYGSKLKVYNVATWICDPTDLCFSSIITAMCLDGRYKLWIRCVQGQLFVVDTLRRKCDAELKTNDGENGSQTIAFDGIHNRILTANRNGTVTSWNASSWERLYDINLLEIYRRTHNIQEKTFKSEAVVKLRNPKEPSNNQKPLNRKNSFFGGSSKEPMNQMDIPDIPLPTAPAQTNPSSTDKLERLQIYEDLLFACYRDDYIIVLSISDINAYSYEHLISVKYKTGDSVPIDSFFVYKKQLWVSHGCIISIFNVQNTNDENSYNLLMKMPVDDDNLVTMLGYSGYIWAGSLNGNVYVFRMDNFELYKTFAGHRDSVWCLCSMFDKYVVSGSAKNDTSIAIWENVETSSTRTRTSSTASSGTNGGSTLNLPGPPNTPRNSRRNDSKDVKKPIDIL